MPHSKGNTLFRLVKSLTKSEKRYVRLYLDRPRGRKSVLYARLWDALLDLPVYEEDQLLHKLGDPAVIRQLPVAKTRLFEAILDALGQQYDEGTVTARLLKTIATTELLYARNLGEQALRRLKKARQLAESFDRWDLALAIVRWQLRITSRMALPNKEKRVQEMIREAEAIQEQFEIQQSWWHLMEKFRSRGRASRAFRDQSDPLPGLVKSRNTLPQPAETDLIACTYVAHIAGMHAIMTARYDDACAHYLEILPFWAAQPNRIADQGELYLALINNYLAASAFSSRFEPDNLSLLESLLKVPGQSIHLQFQYERVYYFQMLIHHLNLSSYEEGRNFISRIRRWMQQNSERISTARRIGLMSNILVFFFIHDDFEAVLVWSDRIQKTPEKTVRDSVRHSAKWFERIARWELGEDILELLPPSTTTGSTENSGKRVDAGVAAEQELTIVLRYLARQGQPEGTNDPVLSRFSEQIRGLLKSPGTKPWGLIEWLIWGEAQLAGQTVQIRWKQEQDSEE